jgi:hypothetical protein
MVINLGPPSPGLRVRMTQERNGKEKRMFTIELRSKADVRNVSLDDKKGILIEGSIGSLVRARFLDDLVLEVVGSDGELRMDLSKKDLERITGPERSCDDRGRGA